MGTEQESGRAHPMRAWRWILGATLLGVAMALTALRESDQGTAFALGAAMGSGFLGITVAAIVRLVWTRTVRKGRPAFSPAWLGVAAVVSLLGTLLAFGQERRELEEDFAESETRAQACLEEKSSPFGHLGGGLSYAPLTPVQERQFEAAFGQLPESGLDLREGRRIIFRQRPIATMMALPGFGTVVEKQDFLEGFRNGAEEQGLPIEMLEVGESPALLTTRRRLAGLATTNGCYAIVLFATDRATSTFVAERALRSGE